MFCPPSLPLPSSPQFCSNLHVSSGKDRTKVTQPPLQTHWCCRVQMLCQPAAINSVNTELDTSSTLPLGSQAPDWGLRRNNSTGLSDFHLVSGVSTSYQPSPPIIFITDVWLLAALSSLSPAISICVCWANTRHQGLWRREELQAHYTTIHKQTGGDSAASHSH